MDVLRVRLPTGAPRWPAPGAAPPCSGLPAGSTPATSSTLRDLRSCSSWVKTWRHGLGRHQSGSLPQNVMGSSEGRAADATVDDGSSAGLPSRAFRVRVPAVALLTRVRRQGAALPCQGSPGGFDSRRPLSCRGSQVERQQAATLLRAGSIPALDSARVHHPNARLRRQLIAPGVLAGHICAPVRADPGCGLLNRVPRFDSELALHLVVLADPGLGLRSLVTVFDSRRRGHLPAGGSSGDATNVA